MPPMPPPTKNQPVIVPVTCIRSSARVKKVGKIDARETPSSIVPIQSIMPESLKSSTSPRLIRQPTKSSDRIVKGLARVETQTPSKRPRAKDPQKAEVK